MRQGLLAGRYWAAATMAICALVPFLALSATLQALSPIIAGDLHMSAQTMALGSGMANAGYAVGTVLAVQFAQHLPQRRMMVLYAALLLVGSALTAAAQSPAMFIAGRILQGLCTSLMLIAAVPPLALGFGLEKFRWTGTIMSLCIFGAVAIGPTVGGIQAEADGWRPLFWIVAAISLTAFVLALLTFEDSPPADRTAPRDGSAIGLAVGGCFAAFYGSSQLLTHSFLDPIAFVPLVVGLVLIIVLVVSQYLRPRPLLTVRVMFTNTISVAGIVVALFAATASVVTTELTASLQTDLYSPVHLGLLYLPELGGAILTAFLLGALMRRKELQYLPLVGMVFLAAGICVFRIELPPSQALTLIGSGLLGIGLGASVSPALFVAGFSVQAVNLQRVFAIVELLRAVAAFMMAPVFAKMALTLGDSPAEGTGIVLWIGFGLAVGGSLIAVLIYLLGGARPHTPDLARFLAGETSAWPSPPLLAAVRRRPRIAALAEESVP